MQLRTLSINDVPILNRFIYLLSFFLVFVDLSALVPNYKLLRLAFLIIVFFSVLLKAKLYFNSSFYLNCLWILFAVTVILSSFLYEKHNYGMKSLYDGLLGMGSIVAFAFLMQYAAVKKETYLVLKLYYMLSVIIALVVDFLTILSHGAISIIGNKFSVSYFHILVIMLWFINVYFKKKKLYFSDCFFSLVLFVLFVVTDIVIDCMTGLSGMMLVAIWCFFTLRFTKVIVNPFFVCCAILASYLFVFIAPVVLSNKYVIDIVVNYYHRDITMTGRTNIFEVYKQLVGHIPLCGFGYGNSQAVLNRHIDNRFNFIPNSQNGMAEWTLQGGVVSFLLILLILSVVFGTAKNSSSANKKAICICASVILTYISIAVIEVSYGIDFFGIVGIMYSLSLYGKDFIK